jgi:hypothetical protein
MDLCGPTRLRIRLHCNCTFRNISFIELGCPVPPEEDEDAPSPPEGEISLCLSLTTIPVNGETGLDCTSTGLYNDPSFVWSVHYFSISSYDCLVFIQS